MVITRGMSPTEKGVSSAMGRTNEWISSQEIPADITVKIGDASFSLHKFPIVSKCGYISKAISETKDADLTTIEINNIPGGAEAFELAAKFCYGINFEMSTENIALIRCVAEYLKMTEDYAVGNLVERAETYLNEVTFKSLSTCVTVLLASENLMPIAEQVNLASRCVDSIAYLLCEDSRFSGPDGDENGIQSGNSSLVPQQKPIVDWWAEGLTMLRINMFQRVIVAMIARGFKQFALGPILMLYAQKSLRGLDSFGKARKKIEPRQEHEKRVILETIVSLLPRERNVLSVSFLSMLLRSSIYLKTTFACRLDLEKRMASQLGQAVLDDLLIPSYSFTGETLFDVYTVKRIMMDYLEFAVGSNRLGYGAAEDHVSPAPNDLERVGKLMENYLAEIASDWNLSVSKFINLAEIVPEQSRVIEDGIYRAIDIFLKAHLNLSDIERKKVCSLMDCQKLSREACAHAAQNDRLPVQIVVQVLYYEQQRLCEAMSLNKGGDSSSAIILSRTLGPYTGSDTYPSTELRKLRRENEDLKIELLKLKKKLKEVERSGAAPTATATNNSNKSSTGSPAVSTVSSADKPPLPRKSFMGSMSKKLGRLLLVGDVLNPPKGRAKPNNSRRHSVS